MTRKNKTYLFIGAAIAFYFWKKRHAAAAVSAVPAIAAPETLQAPPTISSVMNGYR